MSEKRVKVASRVKGIITLSNPDIRFRREWLKKGQVVTLPFDILQDMIYEDGVKAMFDQGILEIIDKADRVALGLEEETNSGEGTKVAKFVTENQMLATLVTGTVPELKKLMDEMPRAQLEELVELAVEKEITSMDKVDAIEKKTGKNVIKLVQFNRQLKEESKSDNE